jgi:hypothetical protein
VLLPFFSITSYLIAVPTGIKFFNWTGTLWKGQLTFETPMLFSIGFLVTFLLGGLSGVLLASPPIDFHVTDSYFVVAQSTTRGDTATRWSGQPAARRRGTTSPSCPGSAPSAPHSSCTTHGWSNACAPNPTSAATPK